MGTELEWKLELPTEALLDEIPAWEALRALFAESPRHYHMQTTYYDLPDGSLSRRRITLRRRLENERSVICVKAPLPDAADSRLRGEWELEGAELRAALPRLAEMGAPVRLPPGQDPVPVCGADFRRTAVLLRLADGSACELALDRGVLFGAGRSLPLCELELELKEGPPDAAEALSQSLRQRFGLRPQAQSKYARARSLCADPQGTEHQSP